MMAEPSKLEERLRALPLDELEEELRKLQKDIERIRNMTLGDVVQELGLSLWEWLGELAFRLSEYADYSDLEPRIPSARVIDQGDRTRSFRVIRRTPIELKDVRILTVVSPFTRVGEGTRRRRGGLRGVVRRALYRR